MKILYFLCSCVIIPITLLAQEDNRPFKKADNLFYNEKFEEALRTYHSVSEKYELTSAAQYHMEICSLLTDYSTKPIDDLLSHSKRGGKDDKFYQYWLGRVYFVKYEFNNAIEAWEKFRSVRVYKSQEIIDETNFLTEWSREAHNFHQDVGSYNVSTLSADVNSSSADYSPIYMMSSEELMFVSDRNSDGKKDKYHIYSCTKKGENWTPAEMDTDFELFDNDHPEIKNAPGGEHIVFAKDRFLVDLVYSEATGEAREEREERTKIRQFDGHFFINKTHDKVLFTHRKRSVPNDLDIYEMVRNEETGKWSKPSLLSENISSFEDEDYPFLTEDGKSLYFSSKGFNTVGGYDIFRSVYDEELGDWSKPIQLKYPVNTVDDDIEYVKLSPTEGYFVSNRYGGYGDMDIYSFTKDNTVRLLAQVNDVDNEPITDHILVDIKDAEGQMVTETIEPNENGHFEVVLFGENDYSASLRYKDYELNKEEFTVPEDMDGSGKYNRAFKLDRNELLAVLNKEEEEEKREEELVDPEYEEIEHIASKFRLTNKAYLENIYFEFNNYTLKNEDRKVLKELVTSLMENPTVKVEVAGHADSIGTEEQNLKISKWRANTVKKYLEYKGVPSSRIIAKGYGEEKPVASNDKEEGRELNRRIEIVVLD